MSVYSNGLDDAQVHSADAYEDAKSVGNGFTFRHDLRTKEEWRAGLDFLSEDVGRRLRKKGLKCSTVQITIKDEYLRSIQRQKSQNPPTDISSEIAETAYELLLSSWQDGKPIRMLTITASNLANSNTLTEQMDFFAEQGDEKRDKKRKAEDTVDKIRQKHGSAAIVKGFALNDDLGIFPQ